MKLGGPSSRRIDPLLALAAVAIVIVAALTAPPVRDGIRELAMWLDQRLANPAWVGYYNDESDRDAMGAPVTRVMFAVPGLPGRPVPSESAPGGGGTLVGNWSTDGERMLIRGLTTIYVGDRSGSVRKVVDLGLELIRGGGSSAWVGPDEQEILVLARTRGCAPYRSEPPCGFVLRIDPRTRAVQRWPFRTEDIHGYASGAGAIGAPASFSPDGRWLPFAVRAGGCYEQTGLYEIATGRVVALVDGQGRALSAVGWLRDGRLVSAFCERDGQTELFVSTAEARPTQPFAVLARDPRSPAIVDGNRDRILVQPAPSEGTVYAVDLDGRKVELVRVPPLTTRGGWAFLHPVSRDGKHLSFTNVEIQPNGEAVPRTGLIEIATGRVAWTCEIRCGGLRLR